MTLQSSIPSFIDGIRSTVAQLKGQGRLSDAEKFVQDAARRAGLNETQVRAELNRPIPNTTATTASNARILGGAAIEQRRQMLPVLEAERDFVLTGRDRAGRIMTDVHRRTTDTNTGAFRDQASVLDNSHRTRTQTNTDAQIESRRAYLQDIWPFVNKSAEAGEQSRAAVLNLGNRALDNQDRMQQRYVDAALAMNRDTSLDWLNSLGNLATSLGVLFMA